MVILRNIILVLAVSVCLAAACQKEDTEPTLHRIVDKDWYGADTPLQMEVVRERYGAESHIERMSESRQVDLYIEPELTDEGLVIFDAVIEGIPDTIHCAGGWVGAFQSYKVGGLDITIYCKKHVPARASLKYHLEELDFAYSEDVAYEPLNVSYHW